VSFGESLSSPYPRRARQSSSPFHKARKQQRYEPSLGLSQYFSYKGRLFLWYRQRERRQIGQFGDMYTTVISGQLYCLSRSTAPIKALIEEVSEDYHKSRASMTVIRRPAPSQQRKERLNPWKTAAVRPSRPLRTVVLGGEQKDHIISDIEEYLHRTTRQW
jgi:hypothetical protein